ncbi:branched-subunit amino acid transport protein [Kribbella antiqua]|uniref:Branched-subunit amino acid transport protein n=2 Tax=Kribbella antiqua TaxID=2512217 RepID=A0A4R2ILP2_9ACTN|nr:branched-subunit amino acid transport protein [Kribbella antiqua]
MIAMLLLGAVSWVLRIAFITLLPADRLPARLKSGLEYLAPAVLASIVAVELVALVRDAQPADAGVLLAAGAAIGIVAYRTRNVSIACALGVGVVLILGL